MIPTYRPVHLSFTILEQNPTVVSIHSVVLVAYIFLSDSPKPTEEKASVEE